MQKNNKNIYKIHRAKLAQGLTKLLPDYAFEKIFPILFMVVYIAYITLIILKPIEGHEKFSTSGTIRYLCIWNKLDVTHMVIIILSITFDVSMTGFFLYLYGKPMLDIVKHSSLRSHTGQISTNEIKLRRCITVNFVCSSISSIHTAIVALTWWNITFMSYWLQMDFVVNCVCLFGMFASNRRLMLHCCCCHVKCMEKRNKYYLPNKDDNDNEKKEDGKLKSNHKHVRSDTMNSFIGDSTIANINDNKTPQLNMHAPSFQTMSDFPQPKDIMDDKDPDIDDKNHRKYVLCQIVNCIQFCYRNVIYLNWIVICNFHKKLRSIQERLHAKTASVSRVNPIIIPPADGNSTGNQGKIYKDIAEKKSYISDENGINYVVYLDTEFNGSSWYYKSKLFYTWFSYYFCFCGNKSVCKCYICLCKLKICKDRIKSRRHVMKFMFGAAKKIQYNRYVRRYQADTFNFINHIKNNKSQSLFRNRSDGRNQTLTHSPRQSVGSELMKKRKETQSEEDDANSTPQGTTSANFDKQITNFTQVSENLYYDDEEDEEEEEDQEDQEEMETQGIVEVELQTNIR